MDEVAFIRKGEIRQTCEAILPERETNGPATLHVSVRLYIRMSVCLYVGMFMCPSIYVFVHLYVCVCVCVVCVYMSVGLCVHMSHVKNEW